MPEQQQTNQKLPLPNWCFVLLAVPTFYMPLVYLSMAVWVIGSMIFIGPSPSVRPPQWILALGEPSLYVTIAMWPIYVAWVVVSKRLTWREKALSLFVVSFLNMLGMPLFYIFMIRRYLGLEGRRGPAR